MIRLLINILLLTVVIFLCSCSEDGETKNKEKLETDTLDQVELIAPINSSLDTLIVEELLELTNRELGILRNDVYARNGYIFKNKELAEHYKQFDWYSPTSENVNDSLSELEKQNIEAIRYIEYGRQNVYPNGLFIPSMYNFHFKGDKIKSFKISDQDIIANDYADTVINPVLEDPGPSYFTDENTMNVFFFIVPMYRNEIMIRDNVTDVLNFMLMSFEDEDYMVERPIVNGEGVHGNFEHNLTILKLINKLPAYFFVDKKIIKAEIDSWGIDSDNECPGDFPLVLVDSTELMKYREYSDPWEDGNWHLKNMNPVFSFGYIDIKGFVSELYGEYSYSQDTIQIQSKYEGMVEGVALELTNDGIYDVFWTNTNPDDEWGTRRISRLFINIDGKWVMRYVDYFHGCY